MTAPSLEELGLRPPGPDVKDHIDAQLSVLVRLRAWCGVHRRSLLIIAALLVAVGVVHGWGLAHAPALTDDEGTYVSQAWAFQHQHRLEVYTYWYDHPPFGWMQIAVWTTLTGWFGPAHAVVAGRVFMLFAAEASATLVYLLARRTGIRRPIAAAAVLAFALSPLAVDYQRMVYLDNIAVPWVLASLVLAASPRRSLWAATGSGACLAAAVLSKETFLLFAPAVLVLLWNRSDPKTRAFCLTGLCATFVLLVAAYPMYALLKGELLPGSGHVSLWQGITFQLSSRQGSGSVFSPGSNAHRTVAAWLAMDRWLLFAGVVAAPVVLLSRRYRAFGVGLVIPVLIALRGGYLPEPFVIGLLPFAAMCAAGAAEMVAGPLWPRWTTGDGEHLGRAGSSVDWLRRGGVSVAAVTLSVLLLSAWYPGDGHLMSSDATSPVYAAESWIESHVPRDERMIVDNTLWTDLISHGFDPDLGVVWFQKLDFTENLDPSVARTLPGGWRDFAYVISTPALRSSISLVPTGFAPVREALQHSVAVASFGTGAGLVEVRRIVDPAPLAIIHPTKGQP